MAAAAEKSSSAAGRGAADSERSLQCSGPDGTAGTSDRHFAGFFFPAKAAGSHLAFRHQVAVSGGKACLAKGGVLVLLLSGKENQEEVL